MLAKASQGAVRLKSSYQIISYFTLHTVSTLVNAFIANTKDSKMGISNGDELKKVGPLLSRYISKYSGIPWT